MACSGCAERRDALLRAGKAIVRGDVKTATAETADVAKSATQDLASVLRQKTAAARQRLSTRR